MSIKLQTINDLVVKPIPIIKDPRPIKGANVCADCYSNIFLVAPTSRGKTTLTFKLLKECAGKNTKIIAFVSSIWNDENWVEIRRYFEHKGIWFEPHLSFKEDGHDLLAAYVKELAMLAE